LGCGVAVDWWKFGTTISISIHKAFHVGSTTWESQAIYPKGFYPTLEKKGRFLYVKNVKRKK